MNTPNENDDAKETLQNLKDELKREERSGVATIRRSGAVIIDPTPSLLPVGHDPKSRMKKLKWKTNQF